MSKEERKNKKNIKETAKTMLTAIMLVVFSMLLVYSLCVTITWFSLAGTYKDMGELVASFPEYDASIDLDIANCTDDDINELYFEKDENGVFKSTFKSIIADAINLVYNGEDETASSDKADTNTNVEETVGEEEEVSDNESENVAVIEEKAEVIAEVSVDDFVTISEYLKANFEADKEYLKTPSGEYKANGIWVYNKVLEYMDSVEEVINLVYAGDAIDDLYDSVIKENSYSVNNSGIKKETAFELRNTVNAVLRNDEVRTKVNNRADKMYRVVETTYSELIDIQTKNEENIDNVVYQYNKAIDLNMFSDEQKRVMLLATADSIEYIGNYSNYNLDEETANKLAEMQEKIDKKAERYEYMARLWPTSTEESILNTMQRLNKGIIVSTFPTVDEKLGAFLSDRLDCEFWMWSYLNGFEMDDTTVEMMYLDNQMLAKEMYLVVGSSTGYNDIQKRVAWAYAHNIVLSYIGVKSGEMEDTGISLAIGDVDGTLKNKYLKLYSALTLHGMDVLDRIPNYSSSTGN